MVKGQTQNQKKRPALKKAAPAQKVVKTGLSLKVYDLSGKEKGKIDLPKEIFSVQGNPKLLAQYIRVYLTNQRQGTASTKTRAEVKGSTRKIYRQKGTGRARHGSRRAPIFVGGGIIGGPKPKNYSLKMNKKQKRKAIFNALTLKYKEDGILGLADDSLKIEPKTKLFLNFLKKIDLNNRKVLLVLPKLEKNNLVLAARNIPNIKLIDAKSVNPYVILNSQKLVVLSDAVQVLKDHFLKKNGN